MVRSKETQYILGCSIVALLISGIFTSSGRVHGYKILGCKFINREYHVENNVVDEPTWGSVSIKSAVFSNEEKFRVFYDKIQAEYTEVLTNELLNNVDDFLDLKDQFRKTNKLFSKHREKTRADSKSRPVDRKCKLQFDFQEYRPRILGSNRKVGAALNLQLMETLSTRYSKYANSMYLGAVSFYNKEDIHDMYSNHPNTELPEKNFFLHYVGVMKIKIDWNPGYLIFNPGGGLAYPVVVLTHKIHPNTGIIIHNSYESVRKWIKYEYKIPFEDSKYIYNLPTNNTIMIPYYEQIFVGMPYCSFLDTTHKHLIKHNNKYIKRRNAEGRIIAEFRMELFRGETYKVNPDMITFQLSYVDPENGSEEKMDMVSFSQYWSKSLPEPHLNLLRKVNVSLNGILDQELDQIYSMYYNDDDFLKYVYTKLFFNRHNVFTYALRNMLKLCSCA